MHKVKQLISIFFLQQKHVSFYESTCSLNELDENQFIQKFQNLEILKVQGKGLIFLIIWQNIMFNGFKMFNFRCGSHVKEKNLTKKNCLIVH